MHETEAAGVRRKNKICVLQADVWLLLVREQQLHRRGDAASHRSQKTDFLVLPQA